MRFPTLRPRPAPDGPTPDDGEEARVSDPRYDPNDSLPDVAAAPSRGGDGWTTKPSRPYDPNNSLPDVPPAPDPRSEFLFAWARLRKRTRYDIVKAARRGQAWPDRREAAL